MKEGFQLREVFNKPEVKKLAQNIKKTWAGFNQKGFTQSISAYINDLSFGGRSRLIADQLKAFLPDDFPKAADILIKSLGPELGKPELTGFEGFIIMPQCLFISRNGLDYFDISMRAFYEMTKRFSAEGEIRPFINKYPNKTSDLLAKWAGDSNCHVRRLVSEGTRPRLPLASRLPQFQEDPRPVLKLLEKLKTDPELYVRRSVANNLNDISKDNSDLVVETLKKWQKVNNPGTQWIINHASRSLIKAGNKRALSLLGFKENPLIKVEQFTLCSDSVKLGSDLFFDFKVKSLGKEPQDLMIDFAVHYMKANGKLAPKVFKLAKKKIPPCSSLTLSKKHSFKPFTTRKHYPGNHLLVLIINGKELARSSFNLKT